MKTTILLGALLSLLTTTSCRKVTSPPTTQAKIITQGIKFSEGSVSYNSSLLISNFGTNELDPLNTEGKGYILKIVGNKTESFIEADGNLSSPKGMAIKDSNLYITDVGKLVVYNLSNLRAAPQIINFPEENLFVNDIVISENKAYISVTNTGKLFSLDITNSSKLSESSLTEYTHIVGANGLALEGKKLYIASYPADGHTTADNVIYVIKNIDSPVVEKLIKRPGQYDGLAINDNLLYFSNWENGEIGFINLADKNMNILQIDGANITGPADISIINNQLYIPNLPSSEIITLLLK